MGLCRSCDRFDMREVVNQTIKAGFARIHLDNVKEGTLQQCDFCLVLLAALRRIVKEEEFLQEKKEYLYLAAFDSRRRLITNASQPEITVLGVWLEDRQRNFLTRVKPDKTKSVYLPVKADLTSLAATSGLVRGRFPGYRTDSQETASIISEWLERCSTSHRGCSPSVPTGTEFTLPGVLLPTRCLEVTHKVVRLCETKGMIGRYLILSHRWSKATAAWRTTSENYDDRLRGRGLANLPKLFSQAIELTLKLGFRFIWIDSFCIIQNGDDDLDWNKEVMNMAQYYQQATLTIFAMRSQKPGAGMFVARQQAFVPLAQLSLHDRQRVAQGRYCITDQQEGESVEDFIPQIWQQDLLKRAWIFQEWFLSTRIVYFTSRCVWFECKSGYPIMENQEEFDPKNDSSSTSSDDRRLGNRNVPYHKADLCALRWQSIDLWYHLIEIYSMLHLSHPGKDRLFAVSGIAKTIRDMFLEEDTKHGITSLRYEYVAGLWLRDIHYGLLWYQRNHDAENTLLTELPTWSWASFMHGVAWFSRGISTTPAMTVVAVAAKTSGDGIHTWFTIEDSNPRDGGISWLRDADNNPHSIGAFDVDNRYSRLRVSAKMLPLMVGSILNDQQILSLKLESDLPIDDTTLLRWHSIYSATDIDSLGGCATIEAPYLVSQLQQYTATMIMVLHVATRTSRLDQAGQLNSSQPGRLAYEVLMVEHIGDDCYRRVGIGCITDAYLMRTLDECDKCEVLLV